MKRATLILLFVMSLLICRAQLIETSPAIPTMGVLITISFHSDRETGALKDYTGDLYAHTGLIIEGSSSWQYVIESWGNNTTQPKFTYQGNYLYTLEITPSIEEFYPGMTGTEDVKKIAIVIRDATAGKQTADLFIDVFEEGLNTTIVNPTEESIVVALNETLEFEAAATLADSLVLYIDGERVKKSADPDILTHSFFFTEYGSKWIKTTAWKMPDKQSDSLFVFVKQDPVIEALPAGLIDGINYISESSVTLVLQAPLKNDAFVLGDFNNWMVCDEGYMKITPDGERYWITIDGLVPTQEYRFQYLVDGSIRVADPYAEKVLDPWNDEYIDAETYPGLIDYPEGLASGIVSVLQTSPTEYIWSAMDFQPPEKKDLVIYELLIRDFVATHHYQTLIDTLDYLDNLGVNAIELMPVNEFDGNLSWGYNPSFYLAPDKYYGTRNDLKEFVDSCHNRGIAVILDIVLNHSTGSSPMAGLYWDKSTNNVSADNPWYNVTATHDYNVFHDFNHDSEYTRAFSKRVMKHWIEEYRVDGYRFDLSKGFTQNNTLGNVGAWGQYDAARVALWKLYANYIWSLNSDFYVILEHFADNSEEKELANYGMMFWGNMNHQYSEASTGFSSDFSWASYLERQWDDPHLIAYMESHDEQRIMYNNQIYGNSSGSYNIKDISTGLERIILDATFFFTVPGPKMIWQFGELGYNYDINYNGRTGEKPIRWDYYDDDDRYKVYKSFAALISLKNDYPAFSSNNFEIVNDGMKKRIEISHESMNVIVLGNFDVSSSGITGNFHSTGWWYEYFTGDSINIDDTNVEISLEAGEYRIYTTQKLEKPDIPVSISDLFYQITDNSWFTIYPNPVSDILNIDLQEANDYSELSADILDLAGRVVYSFTLQAKAHHNLSKLRKGMYFIRIQTSGKTGIRRFIKN